MRKPAERVTISKSQFIFVTTIFLSFHCKNHQSNSNFDKNIQIRICFFVGTIMVHQADRKKQTFSLFVSARSSINVLIRRKLLMCNLNHFFDTEFVWIHLSSLLSHSLFSLPIIHTHSLSFTSTSTE